MSSHMSERSEIAGKGVKIHCCELLHDWTDNEIPEEMRKV